jgi:hypothetical protein
MASALLAVTLYVLKELLLLKFYLQNLEGFFNYMYPYMLLCAHKVLSLLRFSS